MPLETADYIYQLVSSNPPDSDLVLQGDDHLRLIKKVIQQTWPNITGPQLPTTTGSANAQAVAYTYAPAAYTSGMQITFRAGYTNTGPTTINVNGLGVVTLAMGSAALAANALIAGQDYTAVYDPNLTAFNIIGQSGAFLPIWGGTLTGNLTAPAYVATQNFDVYVPQGGAAVYYATVANVRQWYFGTNTDGTFYIVDASGQAERFLIDTAGNANFLGNTVSAGVFAASNNIQVYVSGNALLYLTSAGVREWYIGAMNNGQMYFTDVSANAVRMVIDTAGTVTVEQSLVVGGNINCNILSCAVVDLSNPGGIGYSQQGAGHRIAFTNTGTQLTHYINGAAAGSWNFNTPSDERIKENIREPEGDALEELCKVRLISFDETVMRDPKFQPTHISYGFSAQRTREAIPEAVNTVEVWDTNQEKTELLTVDVMPLLARCIGAIQQLEAQVKELRTQLGG